MGNHSPTRRTVLRNGAGLLAGSALLASTASASNEADGIDTGFNPHSFPQVDRFVEQVFDGIEAPYRQLEEWNETGAMDPVFSELTEAQAKAFLDAIAPRYVLSERVQIGYPSRPSRADAAMSPQERLAANPRARFENASVVIDTIGEDPAEKWGWDKNEVHDIPPGHDERFTPPGRARAPDRESTAVDSSTSQSITTSSSYTNGHSYSDTTKAYAASLDYVAYRVRGTLYWDTYLIGTGVTNPDYATNILRTNYDVDFEGVDGKLVERDEYVEAHLQWEFSSETGKACVSSPFGEICTDVSSTWYPTLVLRGNYLGQGSTEVKSNDSIPTL